MEDLMEGPLDNPRSANLPGGRRRRSFLASNASAAETLTETPAPDSFAADEENFKAEEDDDLPVLTEIFVEEPPPPEPPADRLSEALLAVVASDLVRALEHQLAAELPTLIEASMINAQNELRVGINSTLDMALRDFLAHRQQLSLPLDEIGDKD